MITPEIGLFVKACRKWVEITKFLNIVAIDKPSESKMILAKFNKDVELFYEYGKTSFLTNEQEGDSEKFYTYVVHCYMPKLAVKLFEKYQVGLEIATMQAFKY